MTRDEAVDIMKQQLGFRTDLDDECVQNLKLAQIMLEASPTKPWFLLTEFQTISTEAGERRVPVPDMLTEVDEAGLSYISDDDDDDPVELRKDDYAVLRKQYLNLEGPPEAYALLGAYFHIFPMPDDVYTLETLVYERDTTLDTDVTNGFLTHVPYLLIGTALDQLAGGLRDAGAKQQAQAWINAGAMLLQRQNEARKHANASYQIGGPH